MGDLAALFVEHLQTLLGFHKDDDVQHQFPDPVESWRFAEGGDDRRTLIVRLDSGTEIVLRVDEASTAKLSS